MLPLKKYPFVMAAAGVDWQGVNPALLSGLNDLGRTRGQLVTLTSGKRTYAQQAALYERYKASGFNIAHIAAKPGESNHESGNAVDVTIGGKPLADAVKASELALYGLQNPVKGDPVHTELLGGTKPVVDAPQNSGGAGSQEAGVPADPTPPSGITSASLDVPQFGTPPAAQDPTVEMPGTAQHYLPDGSGVASTWQAVAALPDLSPDTQRLIQLASGG